MIQLAKTKAIWPRLVFFLYPYNIILMLKTIWWINKMYNSWSSIYFDKLILLFFGSMSLARYLPSFPYITAVHLQSFQIYRLHSHARGHCFLHIAGKHPFCVARKLFAPGYTLICSLLDLVLSKSTWFVHWHVLEDEIGSACLFFKGNYVRI